MPRGQRLTSDERLSKIHKELDKLPVADQLRFAQQRIEMFNSPLHDTSYMAIESIDDLIKSIDVEAEPRAKLALEERFIRILGALQNGSFNLVAELNRSSMTQVIATIKDFFEKLGIDEVRFDKAAAKRVDDVSDALEILRSYYAWEVESDHYPPE